jgi:hypothetical protein
MPVFLVTTLESHRLAGGDEGCDSVTWFNVYIQEIP